MELPQLLQKLFAASAGAISTFAEVVAASTGAIAACAEAVAASAKAVISIFG